MPTSAEHDQMAATAPTTPAGVEKRGIDLLSFPLLRRLFRSRLYPVVFQVPAFGVFLAVILFGFLGIDRGGMNAATLLTWTFWWPLLPLALILTGRAWCTVCPLSASASFVQRLSPLKGRVPGVFLRRNGIWIMILAFLFLTWAGRVWGIYNSPRITALMLLILVGLAVGVALLYQRHTFCRWLCPIGALTGLYATTAVVELRARPEVCARCRTLDCYRGNEKIEGCPLYEFPRSMESNRNCNLCGNCIKACPHDSVQLRLRPPGRELWLFRRPVFGEAFLALLIVAVVYLQTVDMTLAWGGYMKWVIETTPVNSYNVAFTFTFGSGIVLVLVLYFLVSGVSAAIGGSRKRVNFATFGYAYLPLALAGHLGHNVAHLVGEGPAAFRAILEQVGLRLASGADVSPSSLVQLLAFGVLALGILGSWYLVWRIGRRGDVAKGWSIVVPHVVFMAVLTGVFAHLFLLPMNPLHTH